MTAAPPAKRQRTERTPTRCSGLWFDDGSVVLQAQNTQFRVHWAVLAIHSSVFRDMQTLPQPPGEASIEGCPIVQLSDDLAVDVANVLDALYHPPPFQKPISFSVVASHVRLGRKYAFHDLLSSAVRRLECINPPESNRYVGWHHISRENTFHEIDNIIHYPGLLFDILTLARENRILSVLPCAYFRVVAEHSQEHIFDGIPGPNNTVSALSLSDQRICILARSKILDAQFEPGQTFGRIFSNSWGDGCVSEFTCGIARPKYLLDLVLGGEVSGPRPVEDFEWDSSDICEMCIEQATEDWDWRGADDKMWNNLPSFFGLPPWGELKNDL
ncbi:hypothetical protein C8R46DRAFT_1292576 [Mycena filopes]|nr:hypothetical protein C8R46DRAFT_1292576 [Mycena filopes]